MFVIFLIIYSMQMKARKISLKSKSRVLLVVLRRNVSYSFLLSSFLTDVLILECCFLNNPRHLDCHKAQCLKKLPTPPSGFEKTSPQKTPNSEFNTKDRDLKTNEEPEILFKTAKEDTPKRNIL